MNMGEGSMHQMTHPWLPANVSAQRDHFQKALKQILEYAEPPSGPLEMSAEEITAAYNALKEIARRAIKTMPPLA